VYFCRIGALCVLGTLALPASAVASPCGQASDNYLAVQVRHEAPLTLLDTLTRVRSAGPNIRRAALEGRALTAEADQAGRHINPVFSAEVENFAGGGNLSGFGQSEITVAVEQTFRLGGKRGLGETAARARATLASAQCSVILRKSELQAAQLYYALSGSIELAALAEETAGVADELAETVSQRVQAGAAAPPELARARADAASLRASAQQAQGNIRVRALELAFMWGAGSVDFILPNPKAGPVDFLTSPRPMRSKEHPLLAAAKAGEMAADAETRLAKSYAVPDLTVSGGFRRFQDSGDHAFVAGVSVPFPLFDKNKDGAKAARLRADAARVSLVSTQMRLNGQREALGSRVQAAKSRLLTLHDDALPAARQAFDASLEGYRAGKFDLTTTLDARRSLIETRRDIILARVELQTSIMQLRALTGAAPFAGETK